MQAKLQRLVNISRAATLLSYFGLILLLTAWYLLISPPPTANPYVIWAVQTVPLALFYPVIINKNLRGHIWLCFFLSIYFMHAVQTAMSGGPNSLLALTESLLVASLFTAAMMFTRWQSKLNKLLSAAAKSG